MKVSHKYRYVFVELPQTASSAVGLELLENYSAENFKEKHALYREFSKTANNEEKDYFVFSSIRNPMDVVVSKYLKYLNNHHNYHSKKRRILNGRLDRIISPIRENNRYKWIQKNNATFDQFFEKYYSWPYTNWSVVEHHKFDYVMRFEDTENDFKKVLKKINIPLVRELPIRNKTENKREAHTYFESERSREKAQYIFGPFMQLWGYTFPSEWGEIKIPEKAFKDFKRINRLKTIFWKYFH